MLVEHLPGLAPAPREALVVGCEYRVRVNIPAGGGRRAARNATPSYLIEATDTVRVMRLDAVHPTHLEFSYEGKVPDERIPAGSYTSYEIMNGEVRWQDGRITHLAYAFEVLPDVAA